MLSVSESLAGVSQVLSVSESLAACYWGVPRTSAAWNRVSARQHGTESLAVDVDWAHCCRESDEPREATPEKSRPSVQRCACVTCSCSNSGGGRLSLISASVYFGLYTGNKSARC